MAKNEENLDNKISDLQVQLNALLRERLLKDIQEACAGLNFGQLEAVQSFIKTGAKGQATPAVKKPVQAPSTPTEEKTFSLVDGKVMFGDQEVKECKLDKNGKLRIKRAGKGLPPEVEKIENEEIKALVLALPVVEE